jgi:hypothetical protein
MKVKLSIIAGVVGTAAAMELQEASISPLLDQCDVAFSERARWGREVVQALMGAGFESFRGILKYAPVGTISNPAGTYGAILFEAREAFPPDGGDYCACLQGDGCDTLEMYLKSGGAAENQCKGSYVLKPTDAVVIIGCAPPEAEYFGLQTNTVSKWLEPDPSTGAEAATAAVAAVARGGAAPAAGQCFDASHEVIPDCTCDPSCDSCGYSDTVKDTNDEAHCVACADGGDVQAMRADGTGFCSPNKQTALYFPEVAALDSINNAGLNSTARAGTGAPFGGAFAVVSTADAGTARTVAGALEAAGMPLAALNLDNLASPEVKLWDGGADWRATRPDTLQMVMRINGAADAAAMARYIQGTAVGSQQAFILRAPLAYDDDGNGTAGAPWPSEPLAPQAWRPRGVAPSEAGAAAALEPVLDDLAAAVNATASLQGLRLSYYGDMLPSEDFGYEPFPAEGEGGSSDVGQCCLAWPHDGTFWSSVIHFSTRDCLYESYGAPPIHDDGLVDLVGATRVLDLSIIGPPPPSLDTYSDFGCSGANGYDALVLYGLCSSSACAPSSCNWQGSAADADLPEGCTLVDDDDDDDGDDDNDDGANRGSVEGGAASRVRRGPPPPPPPRGGAATAAAAGNRRAHSAMAAGVGGGSYAAYEFTCVAGVPSYVAYPDASCSEPPLASVDLSTCSMADSVVPSDALWAGAVVRPGTVVVVLGGMSNRLGMSAFHDVYLPVSAAYASPEVDFDFGEAALEGSGAAFLPGYNSSGGAADVFVAQWGRSCLVPAGGGPAPCLDLSEEALGSNSSFMFVVRHYLDPNTGTGPAKESLPRHRVMVFDAV